MVELTHPSVVRNSVRVLVLGASGFIGSEVVCQLLTKGYAVSGLTRRFQGSQPALPAVNTQQSTSSTINPKQTDLLTVNDQQPTSSTVKWVYGDLGQMLTPNAWDDLLSNTDIVVNCAGVLQDSLTTSVNAVQFQAMTALYESAKRNAIKRIIQISADTAGSGNFTPFLTTKKKADEALKASGLNYTILRPSLVIGRNAFGGTALIRALSAFPLVLPLVYKDSPMETVTLPDVAKAVLNAINEPTPHQDFYLASPTRLSLEDLVKAHRQWLGLPSVPVLSVPVWMAALTSLFADALGWLGWRSPLRRTAMQVMKNGVIGHMSSLETTKVDNLESLSSFLARHPSSAGDVWFARLYLLKPVLFGILSVFWIVSGSVPLLDVPKSAEPFLPVFSPSLAMGLTYATCFLDIVLGVTILYRPWAKFALWGMLFVSLSYIAGSILIQPSIWLDPVGSMVKVIPILVVMLVGLAILDER